MLFDISYLAAFLGGMLTLLPSCGPFILPAFFAIAFKEKDQLIKMILIFFLGLLLTFIPLGLGVSFLVQFFIKNLKLVQTISGLLLMYFGVSSLFGWNIFSKIFPKLHRADTPEKSDAISILLFGMMFGIASGACTAPTFGAVLTLAAQQGIGWHSLTILFTFAIGMILPLLVLALGWDHISTRASSSGSSTGWKNAFFHLALRITFFKKKISIPLTNLLAALLFFALGFLFLTGTIHTATSTDFFTDLSIKLSSKILNL